MKKINYSVLISHMLLVLLFVCILLSGNKEVNSPKSFVMAVLMIEVYSVYYIKKNPSKADSASGIVSILWSLFLIWEIAVTKLNL